MNLRQTTAMDAVKKFPDHPNKTIAKHLMAHHGALYKDVEDARSVIRHLKGAQGPNSRLNKAPSQIKLKPNSNPNPFKLPDSENERRDPYVLPKADNNILLISDLHIPYHDISAVTAALKYGQVQECNTVIINGDLIDFYKLSRFDNDPRRRNARYEMDCAKAFLIALRKAFPKARIYWLKGNHDKRYEDYLMLKAPELFDDPYFLLEERLRLREERITILGDKVLVKAGKLFVHHGHLFFRGVFTPVNAARGLFLKAKKSIICGHVHKSHAHLEVDVEGNQIGTWTTGCLCNTSPDYSPFSNNYVLGFAHIRIKPDGGFVVRNLLINDGVVL